MAFKTILPGAWELTEDVEYNLFSLVVPIAWQQVAKAMAQERAKLRKKAYSSIPVRSLDPIIGASFPNIIQTRRNGWQYPGQPWILATEPVDLLYLPQFIKDWLREEFSQDLGEEEVNLRLDTLDDQAWNWGKKSTPYSIWNQAKDNNGVDIRFRALPDYIANEFLKQPTIFFHGEKVDYLLTFYRVVNFNQGSELMSWPPQRVLVTKSNDEAYISFVIYFKLQTIPWRKEPILYHQLSIRRWIVEPLKKFPYPRMTVFMGDDHRWLDGVKQPFCFMPLFIEQKITQQERQPQWSRAMSELLKINDSPLPDPHELAENPRYDWSEFGENPQGIQAAIPYNTRHQCEPPCLAGVSPKDLASLDQAIINKIKQENFPLCRVGSGIRIYGNSKALWGEGKSKKRGDKSPKEREDFSTPMLRPSLVRSALLNTPENLPHTILIIWETQDLKNVLIDEICEVLNLSPKGEPKTYQTCADMQGEETIYEGALGTVIIKTQHIQDLAQKLDDDNPSVPGKNRQQKRVKLMEDRIEKIKLYLPKAENKLSGALVEIRPKKAFYPPESDPKLALRIGVMQAGYVNQHIHPLTYLNKKGEEYTPKGGDNRVQNAVADLWRQLGILPTPLIDPKKDSIDSNRWLTCFYVLRRTRKTTATNVPSTVAIMVRVNPITGIVQVTTPSLFRTEGWVSYPIGLGYLITKKWDINSNIDETIDDSSEEQKSSKKQQEQKLLNQFVTNCLRDCLGTSIEPEKLPCVLFMAEAQNARTMLTWLQNPKLPANTLPSEVKLLTESEKNRLSIVRLRSTKNSEVPVSIVEGSVGSKTSGLFHWQNICDLENTTLYLSIRKLLTTEQGLLRQQESRLDNGSRQAGNPKPLEIAVVYSPEIAPDKLACFIHALRDRWPYFSDQVSLPFPFPFATLASEYAVSARDEVKSTDNELEESEEFLDEEI